MLAPFSYLLPLYHMPLLLLGVVRSSNGSMCCGHLLCNTCLFSYSCCTSWTSSECSMFFYLKRLNAIFRFHYTFEHATVFYRFFSERISGQSNLCWPTQSDFFVPNPKHGFSEISCLYSFPNSPNCTFFYKNNLLYTKLKIYHDIQIYHDILVSLGKAWKLHQFEVWGEE